MRLCIVNFYDSPTPITWIVIRPIHPVEHMPFIHLFVSLFRCIQHGTLIIVIIVICGHDDYDIMSSLNVFAAIFCGYSCCCQFYLGNDTDTLSTNRKVIHMLKLEKFKELEQMEVFGFNFSDPIEWQTAVQKIRCESGVTLLMKASRAGATDVINKLITWTGANVHDADYKGRTAIIYASMYGECDAIDKLISFGANVHCGALRYASEYGHCDTIRKLVFLGADVDETDRQGETPLFYASRFCCVRAIDKLVSLGANLDHKNKDGQTALMLTAQRGCNVTINKLISLGANITDKDNRGKTAANYASQKGHTKVADKLILLENNV